MVAASRGVAAACKALTATPDFGLHRGAADPAVAIEALVATVDEAGVLHGAFAAERASADWSGMPAAAPVAVGLPCTPAQLGEAVAIFSRAGQAVAVQGGLSGQARGVDPYPVEDALSLA